RAVKEILRVLDDEALLTPNLMRLTRWMADYYLCAWGQVLNAVIPAGAKQRAGTRTAVFLETVPDNLCPHPLPSWTAKQKMALERLREHGQPIEPRQLARLAQCGSGPLHILVKRGLARQIVRRIDKFETGEVPDSTEQVEPESANPLTLNA